MQKNVSRAGLCLAIALCALTASAEKTTVSAVVAFNPGQAAYQRILDTVEAFEKAYPDIDIDMEPIGHEIYHTKLQTLAVSGQLPDILYLWPGKRTAYITEKGLALDLRPYMERDEADKEFLPLIVASQGPNGEVYQLGNNINPTSIVYANDDLLKEMGLSYPRTMKEWAAQAKTIRDNGYFPLIMGNKANWVMQSCMLSALVGRLGGDDWAKAARTGEGSFTDPEFVNALKQIQALVDSGLLDKAVNSLDRVKAIELFMAERAVYFIEGAWSTTDLIAGLEDDQKVYFSLNPLPAVEGERTHGSSSGVAGTGFAINAKLAGTPKADAAWEWIRFYAGRQSADIAFKHGEIPAVHDLDVPSKLDPMTVKLSNMLQDMVVTEVLDDRLDPEGINLLNGKLQELIFGTIDAETVAAEYEAWVAEHDSNRK